MRKRNFKKSQYVRVQSLIKSSNIFYGDSGNGEFRKKSYPFILQDRENNLFAPARNAILDYFEKNRIAWWNGKITNHTLSSQIACLNHLFPIREDKEAVLSLVRNFCTDIIDVLEISTDKHMPAYIQFEAVSDIDHLNEGKLSRGRNCTSIDALIYGMHKDGRKILFPIEWKYVESYGNKNLAIGDSGTTRKVRYTELINNSSQLKTNDHEIYYFEPFYQLMRQTLWTEQMIAHRNTETLEAEDYIHIHVIPSENRQLLNKTYPCSKKEMEETWRSCLNDQSKYVIISPQEFVAPVSITRYGELRKYLYNRYW